jgi:Zn finger protein HypA/HybF involved in hydrogenase expression
MSVVFKGESMDFYNAVNLLHSGKLTEDEQDDMRFALVNSDHHCDCCGAKVSDGNIMGHCPWCGNDNW